MKKILFYFSFFLILVGLQARWSTPAEQVTETAVVSGTQTGLEIRAAVLQHIEMYAMGPVEPRFDPVWQFVPGLHGLEFDFEQSYQNMLAHGEFDSALMVARSTPYAGKSEDFREHRIYRGNENSTYVGLLINVAWGGSELVAMLDILDEHNVQASVFFEGRFAYENRALVLDVLNWGHIVGNHSYSHPADWLSFSYAEFEEEIMRTNSVLTEITGQPVVFFAPPGGAFTDDTVRAAYDQGMYTILWSADSIDWRGEPAGVLVSRVMRRIGPGGLILTHPKPETVIALPEIIARIRAEGYEFRRIDEIVAGTRH
ncbi:MAG: polysaccharide deacetylase family protein [Turicibacter sp.]|nr:polysaccharide deacetylase family protein [Turicibacter sp.]